MLIYTWIVQKKILVIRFGFKAYELDCSDLVNYEIVINSNNKTYTISNKNKALKGAILFGAAGAIVGAADSETILETVEFADLIIRLRFKSKEPFEILTCNQQYEVADQDWRDILDQSKEADEFFRNLLVEM